MILKKCAHCGKDFKTYSSQDYLTCSKSCAGFIRPKLPVVQRLLRKINKNGTLPASHPELGPCWVWTGCIQNGYGLINVDGIIERSHRVAFVCFVGEIPNGLFVCHACDNPPCCNPEHLFLGTNRENILDAVAKGRLAFGERSGISKLTDSIVLDIRTRYRNGNVTLKCLADEFHVSEPTIHCAIIGRTWKHVGGPIHFSRLSR